MTKSARQRRQTGLPRYDARRGWIGGDSRTLYAFTDRRTGALGVHPGGGSGQGLSMSWGPEADVRIATREEAEAHWENPLHAGWKVAASGPGHATKRKYGPKAAEKVRRAMHEFKRGELRSGSGGPVTTRAQAIAIGLSQARRAGGKVPPPPIGHAAMSLDARVRAYLARMRAGSEIDARGIARALGGADPLEADYALERAQKDGLAVSSDGRWFGPPVIQHATKRKSPAQLDREVAEALAGSSSQVRLKDRYSGGDVWLTVREGRVVGAMGSDPKRYVGMSLPEARHRARYGGSGSAHATRKGSAKKPPLHVAYRLQLSPSEVQAVEFARGRYSWPDMLADRVTEGGLVAFTEPEMWQWTDDVDSDTSGGHSPFPLASPALADKLQRFYDERI